MLLLCVVLEEVAWSNDPVLGVLLLFEMKFEIVGLIACVALGRGWCQKVPKVAGSGGMVRLIQRLESTR